jgi:hypothetical protein
MVLRMVELCKLHHAQDHLARQARLLDGIGGVQGELRDEEAVLHREGGHLARLVPGVDELQHPDDLVVARLQRHAEDGLGAVVGALVEGGVEREGDVALDVVHVVDQDGLARAGDVAGDGLLVDGKRRAAGDVLVLGLAPEQGVVLHEAEVEEPLGAEVDRAGVCVGEPTCLGEHLLEQGVEVVDRVERFDRPKKLQRVPLHGLPPSIARKLRG